MPTYLEPDPSSAKVSNKAEKDPTPDNDDSELVLDDTKSAVDINQGVIQILPREDSNQDPENAELSKEIKKSAESTEEASARVSPVSKDITLSSKDLESVIKISALPVKEGVDDDKDV